MNINKLKYHEQKYHAFMDEVIFKYQLYSGLFLSLPFADVDEAGAMLSIFANSCEIGLSRGKSPQQIIEDFWHEINIKPECGDQLLFKFLQFIERQVVLFDALEDAAFNKTHDLEGIGSLDNLMGQVLTDDSGSNERLEKALQSYKIRIVLTAHPTQFYPNKILLIIADMGEALRNNNLDEIRSLFLQMGLTRFNNKQKPTPIDEAASLIWFLGNVFYNVYAKIQDKLPSDTINLELGFWPGGDRDGNPFVVAQTTLEVTKRLRATLLRLYHKDLRQLRRKLTFDLVEEQINQIITKIKEDSYLNAEQLIIDLTYIQGVLNQHYQGLFIELVNDLILKVKLFGFNFVKIDIRQNSTVHNDVIAQIFKLNKIHDAYSTLNSAEKVALLKAQLTNLDIFSQAYDSEPMVKELFDTLYTIHGIQQTNGYTAIERYIISNTNSLSDVFEVYFLISLVNNYLNKVKQIPAANLIKLAIVPLFETIDDLNNASVIMEELYQDTEYKKSLQLNHNSQTIMLGFSDGTKDGGYLMANWSIYLAKKHLTQLALKYAINVIFFDGRGGPPSRGGGNTRDFYYSMGSDIASQQIQLTVQGQTISSNFGTPDSARFNVEQLFTSALIPKIFPEQLQLISDKDEQLISLLANQCYAAYLDLRNDEMFIPYLEEITPLNYLAETNVGSRPAKRNQDGGLQFSDLRAIPFVGAWTQMKQNILGYYGLGTGIYDLISQNPDYLEELSYAYHHSLFFKTLINNAMQSLAKSNFVVTQHLANDAKFGHFWGKLRDETLLTQEMLLKITGYNKLLEMDPISEASIDMREKIVLPLLVIQQYALMMIRQNNTSNKPMLEKLIKKSLAANINASRNSV